MNMKLDDRSRYLRDLAINCLEGGSRGHIGSTFSLIEIFRVLYDDIAKHSARQNQNENRDRILLSKGHGCIAQYVMLAEHGYFPHRELFNFCNFDGILGGHPESKHIPGIDFSTGSLGHGLSVAVGIAQAVKLKNLKSKIFVILGDGEINEGTTWEALFHISKLKLENLVIIIDYNKMQSYGFTEDIWSLEPLLDKFNAFNLDVFEVDGHDVKELRKVLSANMRNNKTALIVAHTIKGKGAPSAENNASWHHKSSFSKEQAFLLRTEIRNA
jgi:transketolase